MPSAIVRGGARFWLLLLLVLAAAAATLLAVAWRDYQRFADAPLAIEVPRSLDYPRGVPYKDLVRQLRREGVTGGSPFYWRLLAREMGVASKLHAGEYALAPGLTPRGLLEAMASGRVVQHAFTIVDGWTLRQLRLALAAEAGLGQTLPGLDDATIAARLGIDGSPEGWFLPETYAWVKGEADVDVLRRAHAATRRTLDALWSARDPATPLATPYEALILASIIEKETGIAAERAEIAGVFARRLRLGMRLQTDPSVVYGIGESYDGNIRRRDLDTDTPYNTYTRAGLPPTPIAMAGAQAIEAALHPSGGNALYFVAVGDGSGRHVFSTTLAEHNRAVGEYLRRSRQ